MNISKVEGFRTIVPIVRSVSLVVALFLVPISADAEETEEESSLVQCQEKPKKKTVAQREAGELFGRAERAFSEGKYTKALRRFLCSLYMVEHPATLTNIESVLKEIDNKELSLRILTDYVELNPEGTLTPRIKTWIVELEVALGKLKEKEEKQCTIEAPKPPTEPVCVTCLDDTANRAQFNKYHHHITLFSIGMIGLGAASLVTGIVLQGVSLSKSADADTMDQFVIGGVSEERRKADKLQVGAIAAFTAGVITGAVGLAQLLVTRKHLAVVKRNDANPAMTEKCSTPTSTEAPEESGNDSPTKEAAPPKETETTSSLPAVRVGLGAVQVRVAF